MRPSLLPLAAAVLAVAPAALTSAALAQDAPDGAWCGRPRCPRTRGRR